MMDTLSFSIYKFIKEGWYTSFDKMGICIYIRSYIVWQYFVD